MKIITEKIEGETNLNEDTKLTGMIVGSTTVSENTLLQLHGMIIGNLILKKGCSVYLHGMVDGDVINKGGYLEIFGIVNGKVIRENGETKVDSKAIIRSGIN
jgi:hypothetical protein